MIELSRNPRDGYKRFGGKVLPPSLHKIRLSTPYCVERSYFILSPSKILYFLDRASYNNSLLMTILKHVFIYLPITPLYMFRASQCSSSGDRIVLIHHIVWLVCVSDCLVCQYDLSSHFPWDVANKILCQFLMNFKTATCQTHLILINYTYLCVVPSTNYEYCNN